MASREPSSLPLVQPPAIAVPRDMTLKVLRALAHPLRRELVASVAARGPLCSCRLESASGPGSPQISEHLGVPHRAGLLARRREGRWVSFSINEDTLAPPERSSRRSRPRCTVRIRRITAMTSSWGMDVGDGAA